MCTDEWQVDVSCEAVSSKKYLAMCLLATGYSDPGNADFSVLILL